MPRRSFIRGAGATLALPLLESMMPLMAATGKIGRSGGEQKLPTRMGMLYMPNGVRSDKWTPSGVGSDFKLSPILQPLQRHQKELLILTGLQNKASFTGDGHYVKTAGWLTGTTISKTTGSDISANGVSMDQIAAQQVGQHTRLSSLELGTEAIASGIDRNVNYTQLYGSHISWRTENVPLPCETNPRAAFDRLFRPDSVGQGAHDQSVLDLVREETKRLRSKIGVADKAKLDQYLDSVREVEKRIEREAASLESGENLTPQMLLQIDTMDKRIEKAMGGKNGSREKVLNSLRRFNHTEHCRIMMDLMALAFWTDSTRVSTFMFGRAVSGRDFSFLDGVNGGHHQLSHHRGLKNELAEYQRINTWHSEQYAYLLDRMKQLKEGEGTLLDNCMLGYGSSLRDGNSHDPKNVPIVVAGKAGGAWETGRHLKYKKNTPLCSLWLSMLEGMGVEGMSNGLGDATKPLDGLI